MDRVPANIDLHVLMLYEGMNWFFNDDDDDFDLTELLLLYPREKHLKIVGFFENVVPTYSPRDFKSHFRVTEETFEILCQRFAPELLSENPFNQDVILPDKMLAITLWLLSNQESYRCVADRFNVAKSTAWTVAYKVINVICQHAREFIRWPERDDFILNERKFRMISGFPHVIGCLDGCAIPISVPSDNHTSYINRKGYHSISLQGICDYKYRFIDVFIGCCGSLHDAAVWDMSDIKNEIDDNPDRYVPDNGHILADAAYPLSTKVMTPFRNDGHLNEIKIHYNIKHAKTRCIIERTFGILKNRFRRLKYILMQNTDLIANVILACCVLHNICIDLNDNFEEDVDPINDENNYRNIQFNVANGTDKRNAIAEFLHENR